MKELISRRDRNGLQLQEGDIVAECQVGKVIWDGKGVIVSRPLGKVVVYKHPESIALLEPEENDCYNIVELRPGRVELTDLADVWMINHLADEQKFASLHLSRHDGDFFAWDNIERIGSIYDFPD